MSTADNVASNAIDGSKDTAWRHSILLLEHPDVCRLKVALSFVAASRVNALVVEPLADSPMELISASYVDSGAESHDIEIGSAAAQATKKGLLGAINTNRENWTFGNTQKVISVGDIIAKKIILTFQQNTGFDAPFIYSEDRGSWRKGDLPTGRGISYTLGFRDIEAQKAFFAEYSFGLKELSVLEREYLPNGLFVIEPFIANPAPVALAVHGDIVPNTIGNDDIEIFLRKTNFDKSNNLIDVESFPVLLYGTDTVEERLFLTRTVGNNFLFDTGQTRFYPDFDEELTVYQDGRALILGTNYEISVDDGATWESSLPLSGTPLAVHNCLIKLLLPQSGSFYTVSYTPLCSTELTGGEVFLNETKTMRLDRYQTYIFNNARIGNTVHHCDITLQIITRSNDSYNRASSFLREIVVLAD
jgi:hypothetical protein